MADGDRAAPHGAAGDGRHREASRRPAPTRCCTPTEVAAADRVRRRDPEAASRSSARTASRSRRTSSSPSSSGKLWLLQIRPFNESRAGAGARAPDRRWTRRWRRTWTARSTCGRQRSEDRIDAIVARSPRAVALARRRCCPRRRAAPIRSTATRRPASAGSKGMRLANEGVVQDVKQPAGRAAAVEGRRSAPGRPDLRPAAGRPRVQRGRSPASSVAAWTTTASRCSTSPTRRSRAMPSTAATTSRTSAASASWWSRWRCSRRSPTRIPNDIEARQRVLKTTRRHRRRLLAVRPPHGAHLRSEDEERSCGARSQVGDRATLYEWRRLDAVAELELRGRHGDARGDAAAAVRHRLSRARRRRSSASSRRRRSPS